jgi:excisionase family DNA binding protein
MHSQALSISQAAQALQVSERTVRNLIQSGQLWAVRTGLGRGTWRIPVQRIPVQSVNAFLAGHSPRDELVG